MGVNDKTHDFIHTSLYCTFHQGGGGGGGEEVIVVVIFNILDHQNVIFLSFSTRYYNGVLWKTILVSTSLLDKKNPLHSENIKHIFIQNRHNMTRS